MVVGEHQNSLPSPQRLHRLAGVGGDIKKQKYTSTLPYNNSTEFVKGTQCLR